MRRVVFSLVLLILCSAATPATRVRCADFASQEAAQAYMQQHGATYLDGDSNGLACERLPHRGSAPAVPSQRPVPPTRTSSIVAARIVSVGDGDTFRAEVQGQKLIVRLACVDAPEMAQSPYGLAASQRLKQLLPVGEAVTLRLVDTDRYGRRVAEVYQNHTAINLQMVREGQAVVYRQYLKGCPDTEALLLQAEAQAKQQHLGFWNQDNPVLPEAFRRSRRRSAKPS